MWKEVLDFDMRADHAATPIKEVVVVIPSNVPRADSLALRTLAKMRIWLGHHSGVANLYGFGRLAWNPDCRPANCEGMTRQNVWQRPLVIKTIDDILLARGPSMKA